MINRPIQQQTYSPEEIARRGERIYFGELRELLEPKHRGKYLVLDTESKKYVVGSDRLKTVEEAGSSFGKKLFFIVEIGALHPPAINARRHAWSF